MRSLGMVVDRVPVALFYAICLSFNKPMVALAECLLALNAFHLRRGLRVCLRGVCANWRVVPFRTIQILYAAEDHRNPAHCGVDPVAIVRCFLNLISRRRQGGSTVEQQFVRTVLGDYEHTIGRKFREQVLAALVVARVDKQKIAASYLLKAYFGSEAQGYEQAASVWYGKVSHSLTERETLEIVARLKYPQPRKPTAKWFERYTMRCRWIERRMAPG